MTVKSVSRVLIVVTLCLCMLLGTIPACQAAEESKGAQQAASVSLLKSRVVLGVDQKYEIKATVTPETLASELKYKSNNKRVATVSGKGVVTARNPGSADITVKVGDQTSVKFKVTVKPAPKNIRLNKKGTVKMKQGKTLQLNATIEPKSARTSLKWKSSNRKVATVDKKGKVSALAGGSATITATTHNKVSVSVRIKVTAADKGEISGYMGQKLSKMNAEVENGVTLVSDGFYSNEHFAITTNGEGIILSIWLYSDTVGKYRIFGVYPGMAKSKVTGAMKANGWMLTSDLPTVMSFASDKQKGKTVTVILSTTGKVVEVDYNS